LSGTPIVRDKDDPGGSKDTAETRTGDKKAFVNLFGYSRQKQGSRENHRRRQADQKVYAHTRFVGSSEARQREKIEPFADMSISMMLGRENSARTPVNEKTACSKNTATTGRRREKPEGLKFGS